MNFGRCKLSLGPGSAVGGKRRKKIGEGIACEQALTLSSNGDLVHRPRGQKKKKKSASEASQAVVCGSSFLPPLPPSRTPHYGAWGPFLESPGNFTGPKSNIQIEI